MSKLNRQGLILNAFMLMALMATASSFWSNQPNNALEGDGLDNSERPLVSNSHFTTAPRGLVHAFAQS